jgi:hypothetical protein
MSEINYEDKNFKLSVIRNFQGHVDKSGMWDIR